eukprot:GHVR01104204.1.p1 GENE.GHVR01104204.1~~GHVR01104204.1.p1  ORF type:complete len:348 (-),score=42.24 GHVR01104204.1:153-1196(-)
MAGSKITDDGQEYQYSFPFTTPSGHELSFYDTPKNQRLVISHASGSHIEFKADGTVFIKGVKDIHTHGSVASSVSDSESGSDAGTTRFDADQVWDIGGKLKIKCTDLDFEIGGTGRIVSGTDLVVTANNLIQRASESISLESTKSVYLDTKEFRERVVSRRSEVGTMENGEQGGINILNVYGNAVIRNDDPTGGITISSKGYLNLVAGQERVDLTGMWTDTPSEEAVGTWTQKVFAPEEDTGPLNVSTPGGDYYFESDATAHYRYGSTGPDQKYEPYSYQVEVQTGDSNFNTMVGNYDHRVALDQNSTVGQNLVEDVGMKRTRTVGADEDIDIQGIQTTKAAKIFLN